MALFLPLQWLKCFQEALESLIPCKDGRITQMTVHLEKGRRYPRLLHYSVIGDISARLGAEH